MNETGSRDGKGNELERAYTISLKEPNYLTYAANDSITYFLLKFRKYREGVIHYLRRIRIETDEMLRLRSKKEAMETEIKKLRVNIRKTKKKNRKLEKNIKREIEQLHLLHSNIVLLRNNKYKLLKLQETAINEIQFMSIGIHSMMGRKQEIANQYYEVVLDKDKVKLENESLKKKITDLKSDEKKYRKGYNDLKKMIKTVTHTVKQ